MMVMPMLEIGIFLIIVDTDSVEDDNDVFKDNVDHVYAAYIDAIRVKVQVCS